MVSTANLIYLLIVAIAAITLANYTSIAAQYSKLSDWSRTAVLVVTALILMALMMNYK